MPEKKRPLTKKQREARGKQDIFLDAIAEGGVSITTAAKKAGIKRATHYIWLGGEDYAKRYHLAEERGAEARKRRRAELVALMMDKGMEATRRVKFRTAEDVRKWNETVVDKGRLVDGESTENIAKKVETTERRVYSPEQQEKHRRLLEGDDE